MLLLLLPQAAQCAEIKLDGAAIFSALAEKELTAMDEAHKTTQVFQRGGLTFYVVDGQQSQGVWRVEANQYCSQWPPSQSWACYDVTQDGKIIKFIAGDGSVSAFSLP